MKEINLPPFYPTQKVVCVATNPLSMCNNLLNERIENGKEYIVSKCYLFNNIITFMAVRVVGMETNWDAKCFVPVSENFQEISYSEVVKEEKRLVSVN